MCRTEHERERLVIAAGNGVLFGMFLMFMLTGVVDLAGLALGKAAVPTYGQAVVFALIGLAGASAVVVLAVIRPLRKERQIRQRRRLAIAAQEDDGW